MAQTVRTFRVFVSSTFEDLKAERNALQARVFPELARRCQEKGTRFQAIDLRWGVSAEASLDQQAMPICLREVRRCQDLSPRPNFVVLLGDRYGWQPVPAEIPADRFTEILGRVADSKDKAALEFWYRRDDNAVPPAYFLQTREDKPEKDEARWREAEADLRRILRTATVGLELRAEDRLMYEGAATEQEIELGALSDTSAHEHVFAYFRSIRGLPNDLAAKSYLDLDDDGQPVPGAREGLAALKDRLEDHLPGHVHRYEVDWAGDGPTTERIDQLCAEVLADLWGVIEQQIKELEAVEQLDREVKSHVDFGVDRSRFFTGRKGILKTIADYVAGRDRRPLVVEGEAGTGKSAVMGKAAEQARKRHAEADEVVVRFIGATPGSSDGRALLQDLCAQLARRYPGEAGEETPSDYTELVKAFPERLGRASAARPVVVFVDALDQLSAAQGARSLIWLPAELPEGVRLVVSTRPDDTLATLRAKHPSPEVVPLGKMPREEGDELLSLWLADAGRTLDGGRARDDGQRDYLLGKFAVAGEPLYLKLAFEEARLWNSEHSEPRLADDIRGVIRENLFNRLDDPNNHGELMVSRSLGYLAASRYGLGEDEMIDVLSRDDELYGHVQEEARKARQELPPIVAGQQRLPVAMWSRLYLDLEPYLTERVSEGVPLLAFYHRELGEVAAEQYLAAGDGLARHRALADYFREKSDPTGEKVWDAYARGLSELPYHLIEGAGEDDDQWQAVQDTLTDFTFLERKVGDVGIVETGGETVYTGVFQLREDYERALARLEGADPEGPDAGRPPVILTGVDFGKGDGLQIRCPHCNKYHDFQDGWRGIVIPCPTPDCGHRLKINSFVVGESALAR
jgi:hypothetical protein